MLLLIALSTTPTISTANAQEEQQHSICNKPSVCCVVGDGVDAPAYSEVRANRPDASLDNPTPGAMPSTGSRAEVARTKYSTGRRKPPVPPAPAVSATHDRQSRPADTHDITGAQAASMAGTNNAISTRDARALTTSTRRHTVWRKRDTHPFDRTRPPRSPLYVTAVFV